jgi:hypothetical protein
MDVEKLELAISDVESHSIAPIFSVYARAK